MLGIHALGWAICIILTREDRLANTHGLGHQHSEQLSHGEPHPHPVSIAVGNAGGDGDAYGAGLGHA